MQNNLYNYTKSSPKILLYPPLKNIFFPSTQQPSDPHVRTYTSTMMFRTSCKRRAVSPLSFENENKMIYVLFLAVAFARSRARASRTRRKENLRWQYFSSSSLFLPNERTRARGRLISRRRICIWMPRTNRARASVMYDVRLREIA